MTEGTIYSDMHEFRVAISQHAIAREFDFKIDKTGPSRFRAHCCDENCKWRIHAARMDEGSIKVVVNKQGHTCSSTRQDETSKHANQNWVADRVKVWLHEDSSLGPIALRTKIKEKYHMTVPYKRVYNGKEQALELYGSWDQSFDKLCSYKAEIDKSCPGSSFVIDHEVSLGARRFTKLFFALKPCIDGFLAGCMPYLAIDSTFLTGKFKGQLAAAVAVDGHNWMYPLASGEQKGKSKKSAL